MKLTDRLEMHVPVSVWGAARLALLFLSSTLLAACTGFSVDDRFAIDPALHRRIIDQKVDRFPHLDPLALSNEIRELLDQTIPPGATQVEKIRQLQEILYSPAYLNLQYTDEHTSTAIGVFETGRANCLSAMNLYVAMARYLGVDAHFQTVAVRPEWDRRGDLLVLSQHVNATGKVGRSQRYVVDFTPEIALQQLTARKASDKEARALYFNNLGAEAMIDREFELALAYLKNSLYVDESQSLAWNNIGTVYNRLGETELGVYSYQMAHYFDDRSGSAISNLAKHYRRNGDIERALEYEQAVSRFNEQNPYYHYAQGTLAYYDDDLEGAREAFTLAIRLKEVEPDFYRALAKVYYDLGEMANAYALNEYASQLLVENEEIYLPAANKLRLINGRSIRKDLDPGITIRMPN